MNAPAPIERLIRELAALDRAYSQGHHGLWSARRRAGLVDETLRELFEAAGAPPHTALAATGLCFGLVTQAAGNAAKGSETLERVIARLGARGGGAVAYLGYVFIFAAATISYKGCWSTSPVSI